MHDRSSKAALSEDPKMKKTKRKASRLSRKSTDEEVIRWTKSHDVFDRLEKGVSEVVEDHSDLDEALREAIFQDNTAQLNMRLPHGHEGRAEQACPPAHNGRDYPCPDMASGAVGTGTQSGMSRLGTR